MNRTVLVVDDEQQIRSSLRGILHDEGFRVLDTGISSGVMELIAREQPRLVLLDVWMPEIDGIELLRQIKAAEPELPVIMISGHANIQSAVAATRLGAADFIEKPFSVGVLLEAIGRALSSREEPETTSEVPESRHGGSKFSAARPRHGTLTQRTISRSIVVAGHGLHTGLKTGVILYPAPPDTGIVFCSVAGEWRLDARLENVTDTGYNTTLSSGGHQVRTVEHLMSALHGFGINNLVIKTEDEIPALDGSALEFCKHLLSVGIQDQRAGIEPLAITQQIVIGSGDAAGEHIRIDPAPLLIIDYQLDYAAPIGRQEVHFELSSPEAYWHEIAPARTFGFVREFRKLAQMGLANGGRLDNVILLDDEKVVNTPLRFKDEFARHKVLDLIGDLYLLGRPVLGHVRAVKTGHADNLALVRAIRDSVAQ